MCKIKFTSILAIIVIYGLTVAFAENESFEVPNSTENLTITSEETQQNLTNSRTGRILKYPPRNPAFTLRRRQPSKILSRADHYPLRTQIRRVQNVVLPQGSQPLRYGYESLKSSKYIPSKGSYGTSVKGTSLRQQLLGGIHPNGVHLPALSQQYIQNFKASPAFNGKVIIHPVTATQHQPQQQQHQPQQQQQQQQQQVGQQQENAYPKYIKPQQMQQQHTYPEFKQFPIPDQQQMQKYNEQHEKYLQQQKYLTPRDPLAYYQQQYQQQQYPQQQQLQQQQQQHHLYQQQQQQQSNYAVHQPPTYGAQKPVQQQHTQPSIPIHEVSGSSVASSASSSSSSAAASGSSITSLATGTQSVYGQGIAAPPPSPQHPPKMYSVYEENDMTELQNNDYQTAQYDSLEKEAQEYLRFMNTNEYFLPKWDPNYKLLDEENDRRQQQYNLKVQPAIQPHQQQHPIYQATYQDSYQPTQVAQQQQQPAQYGAVHADSSTAASSSYNQPIQGSKLYYQTDAAQQGEPSTVVRTSYQTGYNSNSFVVNSQDNKASKYLGSGPNDIVVSTQSPLHNVYQQARQTAQSSRTPEPIRFEFTERDAIMGGISYTHAPKTYLKYKAVDTPVTPKLPAAAVESSTAPTTHSYLSTTLRSKTYHNSVGVKPILELEDDLEDGDDMEPAGSNLYGRQPPQNKSKQTSSGSNSSSNSLSTTASPPSEQKDTEEYCERICAIVEDEHEEIVCGSDGYMYTSEAQMECYASCLRIDITIQGKGSCSAR